MRSLARMYICLLLFVSVLSGNGCAAPTGEGAAAPPRGPAASAIRIVPQKATYVVGDVLRFSATMVADRPIEDELILRVVQDDIRSHKRPDRVLTESRHSIALQRGEQKKFNLDFQIPGDILTTDETSIEVFVNKDARYYSVLLVNIQPRYIWEIDVEENKDEFEKWMILNLQNNKEAKISDIEITIKVPIGVVLEKTTQRIKTLDPGEFREFKWRFSADEAGTVEVNIASKEAGSVRILKSLRLK